MLANHQRSIVHRQKNSNVCFKYIAIVPKMCIVTAVDTDLVQESLTNELCTINCISQFLSQLQNWQGAAYSCRGEPQILEESSSFGDSPTLQVNLNLVGRSRSI